MAKRRKKRKKSDNTKTVSALQKSLNTLNWSLIRKLAIRFALVFSVYQLCLKLAVYFESIVIQQLTVIVYTGITTVLAAAFVLINGGLSTDVPTKEQLKNNLSDKEKEDIINLVKERRAKAKKLLVYLVPFIFTLLFDMLYLIFFTK